MDDISEIKADVKEILQRTAVQNQILAEHKNFSIALQNEQKIINTKIEPLIKDHHIAVSALKIAGAVLVGVTIQVVVKKILGLL